MTHIRGFKSIFTVIGVIYIILASSMLVRGHVVLRDFGVTESVLSSPVMEDFFGFFYLFMAFAGVLMVLFGHVTRGRTEQLVVAATFFIWCIVTTLRDLSTSDSRFGKHVYKGEDTLVFVYIGLTFAVSFGYLVVRGLLDRTRKP